MDDVKRRVVVAFFSTPVTWLPLFKHKVNQDGMHSIWKVQVRICTLVKDVDVRYFLA